MKSVNFGLLIALLFSASLQAADGNKSKPKPKASSQLNTQIYEKSEEGPEQDSFDAQVKVIREVQGDTEVFFEGQKGFFTVSSDKHQSLLTEAQKKKFPVKVVFDPATRAIQQVQIAAPAAGSSDD